MFAFYLRRVLFNRIDLRFNFQIANRLISEVKGGLSEQRLGGLANKYQVFRNEDAEVIMDVNEERLKYKELLEKEAEQVQNPFDGLNLEHGITGVFDIDDLVSIIRKENGLNIYVASVPKELNYVDHICLVNGNSYRHMLALAQFVRKVYKLKKHKREIVPKLEGAESKDWMAIDLGNIALHIFSNEARIKYDLDSLWAVGPKYDKESNQEDPIAQLLERHSVYLHDLKPAS